MPLPTRLLCLSLCAAALLGPALSCARSEPEPARGVDLGRLAGRWYVIAQLPEGHEAYGVQVEYRLDQRLLDESWSAHSGSLNGPLQSTEIQARPDPDLPSRWRIKQGWFSSKDRLLLYVSPGYRRALVGDDERHAAWVLAREPEIPEWSLAGLLARLAVQGYDVSKFRRVVQTQAQVGEPGFE